MNSPAPSGAASPAPGTPSQDRENSLSLKVMRLTRPMFYSQQPLQCERGDLPASAVLYDQQQRSQSPFSLTSLLMLPHSFGNIYLGETFSSYVSINNTSPYNVTQVGIKAELQSPTEKITLLEMPSSNLPVFSPGDNQDFVISHDIKDEGTHILVCSATYVRNDGEKKYFKKFFKFQVDQPLAITYRTEPRESGHFVELQVKNASKAPLFVDSIQFLAENGLAVTELSQGTEDGHVSFFGESQAAIDARHTPISEELGLPKLTLLKPGQIQQYLFCIDVAGAAPVAGRQRYGSVEIVWKSYTGGTGKVLTPPIEHVDEAAAALSSPRGRRMSHQAAVPFAVSVSVPEDAPVVLEQAFSVACVVKNVSAKTLTPRVYSILERQSGLAVSGTSGSSLGTLAPGESATTQLTLIPLQQGIQTVTGIRVVDKKTERHYDFDDVAEVYVQQSPSSGLVR
mmetsp:Transcript_13347/g.53157  ORF Transcript_13347/g.53157 Transcript_13347/m.53157 type:complete len:454 (+) Transcript_13347:55-1416(+)